MAKESNMSKLEYFINREIEYNNLFLMKSKDKPPLSKEDEAFRNEGLNRISNEIGNESALERKAAGLKGRSIGYFSDKKKIHASGLTVLDREGNFRVYIYKGALEAAQKLSEHITSGGKMKDFKLVDDNGNEAKIPSVSKLLAYNANAIVDVAGARRNVENVADLSDIKATTVGNQKDFHAQAFVTLSPKVLLENAKETNSPGVMLSVLKETASFSRDQIMNRIIHNKNIEIENQKKSGGIER